MWRVIAGATLVVAASVVLVDPVPSYDPWMWLLWGRELSEGTLSTVDGPAFKPLPVAAGVVLAPLDGWAPEAWVVLVRFAAALCMWLAFRLGRCLSGVAGGVAGAAALVACEGWLGFAAEGAEPALVLLAALAGAELWMSGHHRAALACGVAAALLRVESWPFLLAAALVYLHRHADWRRPPFLVLGALGLAVVAAWFVPEWIGSGDPLRSGSRARIPNPGQPAEADVPFLAALEEAFGAAPLLVVAALFFLREPTVRAGLVWILLVAVMAQAGFSGEARYALPGVALLAIAGAARLVGAIPAGGRVRPSPRWGAVALVAVLTPAVVHAAGDSRDLQRHRATLADDLALAIERAGGRDAVLACGTPYIGRLRGPLLAYGLRVEKRDVEPDAPPARPGVVFVSTGTPAVDPSFERLTQAGAWSIYRAC